MKKLKNSTPSSEVLVPNISYQGHQGDCGFRELLKRADGYYVKVRNHATGEIKERLAYTFQQITELMSTGRKLTEDSNAPGFTTILKGEAKDHHHGLRGSDFTAVEIKSDIPAQKLWLVDIKKPTMLEHYNPKKKAPTKEHGPAIFPAGLFEMRSQVEEDINGILTQVMD